MSRAADLTPQQRDVLALAHLPNADIAGQLGMRVEAVRARRSELIRKGAWSDTAGEARVTVTIHAYALLFPGIEGEAFEELCADIEAHGLREKIVLTRAFEVLDGRNRFLALRRLGLIGEPVAMSAIGRYFRMLDAAEGEPLAFVLSANLRRRHLTESQRAMVAAKLAGLGHGGARRGVQDANLHLETVPAMSLEAAGEALAVSRRSVATAKTIMADGAPELAAAVARGEVSLNAAEAVAQAPLAAQAEIVARGPAEIMAAAKAIRAGRQAEKKARRAEKEADLAGKIAAGNAALGADGRRYGVILADPEWKFEPYSRESGMDRAADNHYPCSDLDTIKARRVADIAAPDCALFLWATAPMLPQALEVMAAWGFAYKSHLVWQKDALGMGYWFRSAHEILLVGTRGAVPAPAQGDQWASVLAAPRGAHSEKPARVHALIEAYFPTLPKIELNARAARPGWDVWGAEAPGAA